MSKPYVQIVEVNNETHLNVLACGHIVRSPVNPTWGWLKYILGEVVRCDECYQEMRVAESIRTGKPLHKC